MKAEWFEKNNLIKLYLYEYEVIIVEISDKFNISTELVSEKA